MNNEKFIEILLEEYSEEVLELIVYNYAPVQRSINVKELNLKVGSFGIERQPPALSEDEWYELVFELAPDVYDSIYYGRLAA